MIQAITTKNPNNIQITTQITKCDYYSKDAINYSPYNFAEATISIDAYIDYQTIYGRSISPCYHPTPDGKPQRKSGAMREISSIVIDIDGTHLAESDIVNGLREIDMMPSALTHGWSHNDNVKYADKSKYSGNKSYHLHYIFNNPLSEGIARRVVVYIMGRIDDTLGKVCDPTSANINKPMNGCIDKYEYYRYYGQTERYIYTLVDEYVTDEIIIPTQTTKTQRDNKSGDNPLQISPILWHTSKKLLSESDYNLSDYGYANNRLRYIRREECDDIKTNRDRQVIIQVSVGDRYRINDVLQHIDPETYWELPYLAKKKEKGTDRYKWLYYRCVMRIAGTRNNPIMRAITFDELFFSAVWDTHLMIDNSDNEYTREKILSICTQAYSKDDEYYDKTINYHRERSKRVTPIIAQRGYKVDSELACIYMMIIADHYPIYDRHLWSKKQQYEIVAGVISYYGLPSITYQTYCRHLNNLVEFFAEDDKGQGVTNTTYTTANIKISDDELWGVICEMGWQTYGDKKLHNILKDNGYNVGRRQIERIKRQHATT